MKLRLPFLLAGLLPWLANAAILPAPRSQIRVAGHFSLTCSTMLCCERPLEPLGEYLRSYLNVEKSSCSMSSDDAIVLALDPSLAPEAYRLEIVPGRICISGGESGGVFNGIQTLFQLLPPEIYSRQLSPPLRIACLRIEDKPRFDYRGMMLDVARTWIDAPAVKRYIDLLSYHKINKLHLHLSDDEGWRIEIRSHPELTGIGGFRGGDSPIRPVYGKWNEKYGGYYTQDQMRDLIEYAALRNIEIIPEIDLPGHSRNIASVHPEIRCNYPPDTVSTNGYDYRSAWCAAREENYELLSDILSELCELFPSPYLHIGGDEVDMSQWERCPDCRALMRKCGMNDTHRLQELFMERMAKILADNGKVPGVWNEAASGGKFTRQSLVYGWQSVKACLDATAKGYRTVVMPGEYFYFDMRQTPHEDGHDWAAVFDASKVYGFDLMKNGFTEAQLARVAGFEGTFFSEAYISHEPEKPDYLDYMIFPRMCALASIAWSGNAEGWHAYYKQLTSEHYDRMTAMGIRYRLFPPQVVYKEGALSVSADDSSEIRYTDDGIGEPTETSPRCTRPIRTDSPHLYRFRSFRGTGRSPVVADKSFYRTISPVVRITTSMGESEKYPYANAENYKGLSRTRRACRTGDTIDYRFDTPLVCREIYLQTGNRQLPKTIVTTGYVEVSFDGTTFERAGNLEKGAIMLRPERAVRALRVVSTCRDNGTPYVTIQPLRIKPVL